MLTTGRIDGRRAGDASCWEATVKRIGFVTYDAFQLHHACCAMTAFELADSYSNRLYSSHLLSAHGGVVVSSGGAGVMTTPFDTAGEFDTLFIPGGRGWQVACSQQPVLAFISAQTRAVRRIASVASGTGLLLASGSRPRRVAAHWARIRELAGLYPETQMTSDEQLVIDGKIWSTPSASGVPDIVRDMIARDHGNAAGRRATKDLVTQYRRTSNSAKRRTGEDRFQSLLGWARANLHDIRSINDLAERASMPPTQFVPDFAAAIGETPAKAIERLRLEAALELIEESAGSLATIADTVGFHNSERMRRAFVRTLGQSPNAIRALRQTSAAA